MLSQILRKYGLDEESSSVVNLLFDRGELTVLQIAREVGINRTNLYRILDELEADGFVVRNPKSKTTRYSAISTYFLKQKIDSRNNESKELQEQFFQVLPDLEKQEVSKNYQLSVKYYQGGEECKQLIWNSLKATETIRSFGYRSLKEAVGIKFLTEWFNESFRRGQSHMMLANPETYSLKKGANKDSRYKFISHKHPNFYKKRVIKKSELLISHESFIYDDIFAILQWKDGSVFGIEVQNQVVSTQQKHIFDILWNLGQDIEDSSD